MWTTGCRSPDPDLRHSLNLLLHPSPWSHVLDEGLLLLLLMLCLLLLWRQRLLVVGTDVLRIVLRDEWLHVDRGSDHLTARLLLHHGS